MSSSLQQHQSTWWKEATMYEIYPASFKDSNGDGIGDIQGIISKLDYLATLGVDVIWLAPHYKSPQVDMGYDISDFEDIHEPYGSLDDCLQLIDEVHKRGMKIIFDLVINHTSDQHPWFKESRSSKSNPKRDWYMWKPPKFSPSGERLRPNNWKSQFTNPAWTWDENTQEYYLHVYASAQPDLNWENEECRKAIYDTAIRFWLERGVDGFRIDTVNRYSKVHGLPDAPVVNPDDETQPCIPMCTNGPRIHEFLREVRDVIDEYCINGRDVFVVGELPATPILDDVLRYISPQSSHSRAELDTVFNFDTVDLGKSPATKMDPVPFSKSGFKQTMTQWQNIISDGQTWTTTFLENHDQPRSVSRFGSDDPSHHAVSAKMLAMISSTLSGTLFLYQGQELGMTNMPLTWTVDEYQDIRSQNHISKIKNSNLMSEALESKLKEAHRSLQLLARDHARVPMQWNTSAPNSGFSPKGSSKPWMRAFDSSDLTHVSSTKIVVADSADDQLPNEDSIFNFWKESLLLRKKYSSLMIYGRTSMLDVEGEEDLFIYTKTRSTSRNGNEDEDEEMLLVIANLSDRDISWTPTPASIPKDKKKTRELLLSNIDIKDEVGAAVNEQITKMELKPFEARVYLLK